MVWKETIMYAFQKEDFDCGFNSMLLETGFYQFSGERCHIFAYLHQYFNSKFPKHFIFANFRCLKCGECCRWDGRDVYRDDIKKWIIDSRYDILKRVTCREYSAVKLVSCASRFLHYNMRNPCENCRGGDLYPIDGGTCPFVTKVKNKPYYNCRIHDGAPKECSDYLCEKSLSVAHLSWSDTDDLILKIGIKQFKSIIEK